MNTIYFSLSTRLVVGYFVLQCIYIYILLWLFWYSCFAKSLSVQSVEYIAHMHNYMMCFQYVKILDNVYHVMLSFGLGGVDPVMIGEASLRLALLYEATSMLQTKQSDKGQCYSRKKKIYFFATEINNYLYFHAY